jgi:N-acetylneuraminate synthase/N,N'-diacetyllegionaminate synthase
MSDVHACRVQVGPEKPCFIIAEAGVNHNGDISLAKKLIDVASEAGASAVKFQTFIAENVVTRVAEKAAYQKVTTGEEESQYSMIKKLELSFDQFRELKKYAEKRNILFLSTPADNECADFLDRLGVPLFKISSGEVTNYPLLKHLAAKKKPVILSTGMSTLGEIEEAVRILESGGTTNITILHCITNYPSRIEDANLRVIDTLRSAFKYPVGFSDHTEGIITSLAAVAMGACVVEKHFTLDKSLPGPDHSASLDPGELKELVKGIRQIESAMGTGERRLSPAEAEIKKVARRSIIAGKDIPKGTMITEDMLVLKRPGTGLHPDFLPHIIGSRSRAAIRRDQLIRLNDINFSDHR